MVIVQIMRGRMWRLGRLSSGDIDMGSGGEEGIVEWTEGSAEGRKGV